MSGLIVVPALVGLVAVVVWVLVRSDPGPAVADMCQCGRHSLYLTGVLSTDEGRHTRWGCVLWS